MEDAAVVALLLKRDAGGFAAAYEAYADRLFAYSLSLLRDRDAAADAVHDTFIVATQRISQLRDPTRLRPWLYAIARNECLRALQVRRRTTTLDDDVLEGVGGVTDETVDVDTDLRQEELRRLVWSAAAGLNPREREVLELSLRHELDGPALGSAIGVPANHAHALLAKARQQLERALGALIVARTGRQDCATLDGLLSGWDGRMSVLIRKRVARHIDGCPVCGERKRRDVSATALLGATPLLAAPASLRERILGRLGDIQLVAQHTAIAARAGRFTRDGFPIPLDRRIRTFAWPAPAAAAVAAVVLMVSGVLLGDTDDASLDLIAPGTDTTSPETPVPAESEVLAPTVGPEPADPPTPSRTSTPAPTTLPATTSPPTTTEPSEPTSPPPDFLHIYCYDNLRVECELLEVTENGGWITLTTSSDEPATVTVEVATEAPWLYMASAQPITVSPDEPTGAHFRVDPKAPCRWTASVDFTVLEYDHVESLEVTGGGVCVG